MGGSLATVFKSTRSSQGGVNANTQARNLMETVKLQWASPSPGAQAAYDANCIRAALPAGASVTVAAVDTGVSPNTVTGQTVSVIAPTAACSAGANNQALKRVTVTITQGGRELSRLSLDISRP